MLDSARGHGHEQTPLPQGATQDTDLILGTQGATPYARGVEFLQPLTVLHVRLAPGHLARVMGLNQLDLKATLCEYCEQGHPGDAGRLQHHGLTLTLSQPRGQDVESSRKRPKAPHRFLIAILWDGAPVLGRPDSNPGGMEMHLRSRR
jgi:hypothetical protein